MTLNLDLSDDLRDRLMARAAESGYTDLHEYAEALLKADAEEELVPSEIPYLMPSLDWPKYREKAA